MEEAPRAAAWVGLEVGLMVESTAAAVETVVARAEVAGARVGVVRVATGAAS